LKTISEDDWSGRQKDVKVDLVPFVISSEFDWLSVLPVVREIFAKDQDGKSVMALPMDIDAMLLFHQDKHVNLPPVATWQEYIAEVRRLSSEDRDSDGVADKSFCPRSGVVGKYHLLHFIVTSFYQVRGQQVIFFKT
jgi:hypothetical protein